MLPPPRATDNEFGQPVGYPVPTWTERRRPPHTPIDGRFVIIEPLEPRRHGQDLFNAFAAAADDRDWTYMGYGPFPTPHSLAGWMQVNCRSEDPFFHAIIDRHNGKACGMAALMRIKPKQGSIEIGHISMAQPVQQTQLTSEAIYLMARRALDELAYRRLEWKCDVLNARSRRAAERLGFTFEGIFRQAAVYKDRNRDTAWYSIVDYEWPVIRLAHEAWLDPSNFDALGHQKQRLADLTSAALAKLRQSQD